MATPLADRVSGLVLAGFDGPVADAETLEFISQTAGTILFRRNVESASQTAALVDTLQAAANASGAQPLIIAVDQEGGSVLRLGSVGTPTPSAMALGAAGDLGLTEDVYCVVGEELAALGVTLDFAPVADVNNNPENPVIGIRSFGDEPAVVSRHVGAAVRGLHRGGVGATCKHFPGHGDTRVDSHRDLPVAPHGVERLRALELPPFEAGILAGTDAIMTAHFALPNVDPSGVPATLSRPVLTGLLREELAFDGLICTDCMEMDAIAKRYAVGEAAVQAVSAGADLILYSSSLDMAREAVNALRHALADGTLDAAAVERSLERVGRLRRALAGPRSRDLSVICSDAHRRVASSAFAKATTVVRDTRPVLPLEAKKGKRIFLVQFDGANGVAGHGSAAATKTTFGDALARSPARVQEQIRSLDPAGHEYKQLLMAASSADAIVAVTRRAFMHRLQAQAVADLALAEKPLVIVAACEPYDATLAPAQAAVIATFGDQEGALSAAAGAILGTLVPKGKLPVSLPQKAPEGSES